jgi:hypothetical protein
MTAFHAFIVELYFCRIEIFNKGKNIHLFSKFNQKLFFRQVILYIGAIGEYRLRVIGFPLNLLGLGLSIGIHE